MKIVDQWTVTSTVYELDEPVEVWTTYGQMFKATRVRIDRDDAGAVVLVAGQEDPVGVWAQLSDVSQAIIVWAADRAKPLG